MKTALVIGLFLIGIPYFVALGRAVARGRAAKASGEDAPAPTLLGLATGFVTNFFDTLGIGSFAPTTAIFKFTGMVRDERIPGTLNVGHTAPTLVEAFLFIYIATVNVEIWTLTLMILAAVAGSWFGAGMVSGWPRRSIQIGMGCALLVAATLFLFTIFGIAPGGGEALSLTGARLAIGVAINFVLGALMEMGIGLYGPCLILVALLGMNPKAAFPIMMGSCAYLMPIGSLKFIRSGRQSLRASLGLGLGGVPAVLVAFYIVESMSLVYVRWLVVVVVLYAAASMLRSALVESRRGSEAIPG
jgi:uncharacterized membrane protein YfcA